MIKERRKNLFYFFISVLIVLLTCIIVNLSYAQTKIPLPNTNTYFGNQSGSEYTNEIIFTIPYEIRGNYILSYEIYDTDVDGEIVNIYLNDKQISTSPKTANLEWSSTQKIKIEDFKLNDESLKNEIKFLNTNPTSPWGVRNVELIKNPIIENVNIYSVKTDKSFTFEWEDTTTGDNIKNKIFKFYLWNEGEQKKYVIGETSQSQVTLKLPRTGLYLFYVSICGDVVNEETGEVTPDKCSSYTHPALTDENGYLHGKIKDPITGEIVPGKWIIYGHISAPTGGGIE
jgi:hypothetical protein